MGFEYSTLKPLEFKVVEQSKERLVIESRQKEQLNVFRENGKLK